MFNTPEVNRSASSVPLLEVARLLHEHGGKLAECVKKVHDGELREYSKLSGADCVVGIFNDERMTQVNDDGMIMAGKAPGESRTVVMLFIGRPTDKREEYGDYHRMKFFFKGNPANPGQLEFTGCQVGVKRRIV